MRLAHTTTGGLVLAAALMLAGPANADHSGELNCTDFSTQPEAQAHLEAHPGDPDALDRDSDGMACEGLPGAPVDAVGSEQGDGEDRIAMPSGGVATGAGGTADADGPTGLIVAGGVALAAGGGLVLYRRRSSRTVHPRLGGPPWGE